MIEPAINKKNTWLKKMRCNDFVVNYSNSRICCLDMNLKTANCTYIHKRIPYEYIKIDQNIRKWVQLRIIWSPDVKTR